MHILDVRYPRHFLLPRHNPSLSRRVLLPGLVGPPHIIHRAETQVTAPDTQVVADRIGKETEPAEAELDQFIDEGCGTAACEDGFGVIGVLALL